MPIKSMNYSVRLPLAEAYGVGEIEGVVRLDTEKRNLTNGLVWQQMFSHK